MILFLRTDQIQHTDVRGIVTPLSANHNLDSLVTHAAVVCHQLLQKKHQNDGLNQTPWNSVLDAIHGQQRQHTRRPLMQARQCTQVSSVEGET